MVLMSREVTMYWAESESEKGEGGREAGGERRE